MRKQITGNSTPIQLMLAAKVKLMEVHAGLTTYGEIAGMEMKQVERLETGLEYLAKAIHAISASASLYEAEEEQQPF